METLGMYQLEEKELMQFANKLVNIARLKGM